MSTKLIVFEENHAGKESLPTYPMLFVFVIYDQLDWPNNLEHMIDNKIC